MHILIGGPYDGKVVDLGKDIRGPLMLFPKVDQGKTWVDALGVEHPCFDVVRYRLQQNTLVYVPEGEDQACQD